MHYMSSTIPGVKSSLTNNRFLLTHFGKPTPWTPEEVLVYMAKARNDLNNPKYHIYQRFRRVWAQKPNETEKKVETKGEVQTVA